jgi:hypothetical protein
MIPAKSAYWFVVTILLSLGIAILTASFFGCTTNRDLSVREPDDLMPEPTPDPPHPGGLIRYQGNKNYGKTVIARKSAIRQARANCEPRRMAIVSDTFPVEKRKYKPLKTFELEYECKP